MPVKPVLGRRSYEFRWKLEIRRQRDEEPKCSGRWRMSSCRNNWKARKLW